VRLAAQELREEAGADAHALPRREDVKLDHLVVRRIEPQGALIVGQRPCHAVRPPLAESAGVAVAEADEPGVVTGGEEDEILSGGVPRQPLARPFVGERPDAECRPVDLPELRRERQRIDLLDDQRQRRSASRSTTTCVSGSAKRSRAFSTTPRSSQCDRPSGCVEMISSSG